MLITDNIVFIGENLKEEGCGISSYVEVEDLNSLDNGRSRRRKIFYY